MRVSQNEIYRLCQRALEGLGAPMGVDRDGALAVAWLEARGLPGLDLLARDMARLDGALAGKQYLLGSDFTIADLNVASVLSLGMLLESDLSATPAAQAWLGKCLSRPAIAKVRGLK